MYKRIGSEMDYEVESKRGGDKEGGEEKESGGRETLDNRERERDTHVGQPDAHWHWTHS